MREPQHAVCTTRNTRPLIHLNSVVIQSTKRPVVDIGFSVFICDRRFKICEICAINRHITIEVCCANLITTKQKGRALESIGSSLSSKNSSSIRDFR